MGYNGQDLEEITYVFLINIDIPMTAGKVAAQVANVAVQLPKANLKGLCDPRTFVLAAHENYMMMLIHKFKDLLGIKWTVDAGLTEWTIGTLTCLGFKREEWMKSFTVGLPLYGRQKEGEEWVKEM